jgi:hypothetical protein
MAPTLHVLLCLPTLFTLALALSGPSIIDRRQFCAAGASCVSLVFAPSVASAVDSRSELSDRLQLARRQLDAVPNLIQNEKWDSVRAILVTPPLSDCWTKSPRPLLPLYSAQVGESGGDELAALEAKEEIMSHLRFLDMAVYNNVFNPIKAEGTTGASKKLIQSYFEDPTNEYKASVKAMDEMIALSIGL